MCSNKTVIYFLILKVILPYLPKQKCDSIEDHCHGVPTSYYDQKLLNGFLKMWRENLEPPLPHSNKKLRNANTLHTHSFIMLK